MVALRITTSPAPFFVSTNALHSLFYQPFVSFPSHKYQCRHRWYLQLIFLLLNLSHCGDALDGTSY